MLAQMIQRQQLHFTKKAVVCVRPPQIPHKSELVWKPLCLPCQKEWVRFESKLRVWPNNVGKSAALTSLVLPLCACFLCGRPSRKQVNPIWLVMQHSVQAHTIYILQCITICKCLWYSCWIHLHNITLAFFLCSLQMMDCWNTCRHRKMCFEKSFLESMFFPWSVSLKISTRNGGEKRDQASRGRSRQSPGASVNPPCHRRPCWRSDISDIRFVLPLWMGGFSLRHT